MKPRILVVLPVAAGLALAACSGGGTTSTPARVTGLTGLGATKANWDATHKPGSSGSGSYGPSVETGAGTRDRFTEVVVTDGRVAKWTMAFPASTRLADAESAVRGELPVDTTQTASWRGKEASGNGVCEVVDYKSKTLATLTGKGSSAGAGEFAVSFWQRTSGGSIGPSIVRVNTAFVGLPAMKPQSPCPS
jgi:hypothetical protein